MPFEKITAFIVFISFLYSCGSQTPEVLETQIIPAPTKQIINKGSFTLNSSVGISYTEDFKVSAEFLITFIDEGSQIKLKENNSIAFIKDESISSAEGYSLQIFPKRIEIKAKTDQGAFYAVQS